MPMPWHDRQEMSALAKVTAETRDAQNAKRVGLYTFCGRLDLTEAFKRLRIRLIVL